MIAIIVALVTLISMNISVNAIRDTGELGVGEVIQINLRNGKIIKIGLLKCR